MSDIKLFKYENGVQQLVATKFTLERELQSIIEQNMPTFFGATFLKSEYITSHGGRIDSLGVDENNCPVIFEYKRSSNENVINQGLFYLDWLLDHKGEFELMVLKTLGAEASERLDWSMPRLICVAGDFTKYDEYAVKQINRNIDLVRYKKFGDDLLMLELINSSVVKQAKEITTASQAKQGTDKTFTEQLQLTTSELRQLFDAIRDYIMSLGDDVVENQLKLYVAFKKLKNIVCVEVYQKQILLHLKLDPETIQLEEGFTRNVKSIGHFGTGDLQVIIRTAEDFEKAKPFINQAYELN